MDKLKHSQTKNQLRYRKTVNKKIFLGSLTAILLAVSPYLFYLYEGVPKEKIWNTFLFTYESGFYENANTAMWILTGKAIPLFFLLIWFFTCRHWWYHTLLVPITMFIYQIISFFYDETAQVDELQLIYLVPVMAVIIPSIYLIRAKMFNKINEADKSLRELEEEFMMKPKGLWGTIKQYF